ncbi:MAG: Crp/Fnr family transcriptional regulator [Bacteroidota bacterium]
MAYSLSNDLPFLRPELIRHMEEHGTVTTIPKDTEILKTGQHVPVIPIVLEGLIKVCTSFEDRDLLLYYIQPRESCIMSFAASLNNEPSSVFAITEEDTTALLLPIEHVAQWIRQFPDINTLFFQQYNKRYAELLDTIHHVLFNKMDTRLYDYLIEKSRLTQKPVLTMSHRQIASELGTVREVITRVLKRLEQEGKVVQHAEGIEILKR